MMEIRTVPTHEPIGQEYLKGLRHPDALRHMWRTVLASARNATHLTHVEYAQRRQDAARAVAGSRRLAKRRIEGA